MLKNMPDVVAPQLNLHYGNTLHPAQNTFLGGLMSPMGMPMSGGSYVTQVGGVPLEHLRDTANKRANDGSLRCSRVHQTILGQIKNDLESVGFKLSDSDDAKMSNAIDKMSDLEGKLEKLHDILQSFVEVARYFGFYNLSNASGNKNLSIDTIKDRDSLWAFLSSNVGELKGCINNNLNLQASMQTEMMQKLFASMLENSTSRTSSQDLIDI
jgi:hypothetical protein